MDDVSTYDHDPEVPVTRSLLQAAVAEIRGWKVAKGGDDQVVLNLESILARPATEPMPCSDPDGWQPIETAPKDGTFIDLWHKEEFRFTDCRWFTNRSGLTAWHVQQGGRAYNAGPASEFSHWMPRPKPPGRKP